MRQLLHRLVPAARPDHYSGHSATDGSGRPKKFFHLLTHPFRSLDVKEPQIVSRYATRLEAHVNWRHGPGQIRTGIGLWRAPCREDAGAGGRRGELAESVESVEERDASKCPGAKDCCSEAAGQLSAPAGRADTESCGAPGKEFAADTGCAIFERGLATGVRRLLRVGRAHHGQRGMAGSRRISCGGRLTHRDQAVCMYRCVCAVHLFRGEQLRAGCQTVGKQKELPHWLCPMFAVTSYTR